MDGKASVALYAKDGKIWLSQQQIAELLGTSKQSISYHIYFDELLARVS